MIDEHKLYLESSVGFMINRVGLRIKLDMLRAFRKAGYDITPEQWSVLMRLREADGLSHNELAERTLKELPTLTRILELLKKKKLITRSRDDKDKRVFRTYLTDEGRSLCSKLLPIAIEIRKRATQDISQEEIELVIQVLNKILINLEPN